MPPAPTDPEAPDLPPPPAATGLEADTRVSWEQPAIEPATSEEPGRDPRDEALLALLGRLDAQGYDFVPPTPATHARVLARRRDRPGTSLRDVLGWSLPFAPAAIDPAISELLARADALEPAGGGLHRSRIRVARVGGRLFLHSAYPTEARDAVFLGPDTYRFIAFARAELAPLARVDGILDIGAGSGAGGILAGRWRPEAAVTLSDINPDAIRLARINARHAGQPVLTACCRGVAAVKGAIDVALANPPFIIDPSRRAYRDGGDMHGARLSLDWTMEVAPRLRPGGRLLLYTGAAIVEGRDALRAALEAELPALGCELRYRELDPDIFGEELDAPAYAEVERIAAVGAVVHRRA